MKIKDAVVFVTGANRGIGLAFAREAVAMGAAKVYAGMRSTEGFDEPGLVPVRIDVTDAASVAAAVVQCGDVTLLVNNAGIAEVVSDALDPSVDAATRRIMEVNYYGLVRTTQAFAPVLAASAASAILNVLSIVSWKNSPFLTPYAVSKAAAWSYTNHARLALQAQNTAVVGLHVGFVDTDLTAALDQPKSQPRDVARRSYDALEAGEHEVLADEGTIAFKATLSSGRPGYLYPDA